MGFLDQLSRLEVSEISGNFLIVAPLSLVNQWHLEAAIWDIDIIAGIYHGSSYDRDFLVQQELFYTDQFMPKFSSSKLKRQHIKNFSAQNYYNALFCENCGLIIISFSLADYCCEQA